MTSPVSSSNFPYLPIRITIRQTGVEYHEQVLEVEAKVDTGFDGGVVIPKDLLDQTLVAYRLLPWSLADGSEVLLPAFLGDVQIGHLPPVRTIIMPLGDEPLIGRHVTNNYIMTFYRGTTITIEP
jgi:predicted aspartyl protease